MLSHRTFTQKVAAAVLCCAFALTPSQANAAPSSRVQDGITLAALPFVDAFISNPDLRTFAGLKNIFANLKKHWADNMRGGAIASRGETESKTGYACRFTKEYIKRNPFLCILGTIVLLNQTNETIKKTNDIPITDVSTGRSDAHSVATSRTRGLLEKLGGEIAVAVNAVSPEKAKPGKMARAFLGKPD